MSCASLPRADHLMATGLYAIQGGATKLGEEDWQIFRLPTGHYHLISRTVLQRPVPSRQTIEFRVTPDWRPQTMGICMETSKRVASAVYHAEGGFWRAKVQSLRGPILRSFPLGQRSLIDFNSPLAQMSPLIPLPVERGAECEMEAIWLDLPSLLPVVTRQRFTCLGVERLRLQDLEFQGRHYVLRFPDRAAEGPNDLWVDEFGIPLRRILRSDGYSERIELIRYRRFR